MTTGLCHILLVAPQVIRAKAKPHFMRDSVTRGLGLWDGAASPFFRNPRRLYDPFISIAFPALPA